ncbi:MAG: TrkH family potassium uptake protein [Planctomycetota bacterium]
MRFQLVLYLIGGLAIIFGLNMIPSIAWGLYFREYEAVASLLWSMALTCTGGGTALLALRRLRGGPSPGPREGFAVAALGWVVLAGFGALPFYLGGYIPSYLDCYFETMSGLTTTGATILTSQGGELPTDIEALPNCILFWRSYTHWLGGMGIIVLGLALLPLLGAGGMQIYRAEVPGPTSDKLVPRIRQTTAFLWGIYALLSLAQCLLLWAHPRVTLFDAMCHTFGTMATGGFSTHSASIAWFDSVYVEVIIVLFMVLAGANFALHYAALRGRLGSYLRDREFLFYLGAIVLVSGVIALLRAEQAGAGVSLRQAVFQVVSIQTTTGFVTANFDAWPVLARMALLILMFLGGCGGSTAGGMKSVRIVVLLKHTATEMRRMLHPQAVIPVRVGPEPVKTSIVQAIHAFAVLYILVFLLASLLMAGVLLAWPEAAAPPGPPTALTSDDAFITAVSSVAATLNNVGPGLGRVGPGDVRGFSWVPPAGKVILTLCMLIGRLEVFTVVLLFTPWFYR